jgi:hypothetical protein
MEYCSDFGSANHVPARLSLNDSNRCDENEQRVPLGAGGQRKDARGTWSYRWCRDRPDGCARVHYRICKRREIWTHSV